MDSDSAPANGKSSEHQDILIDLAHDESKWGRHYRNGHRHANLRCDATGSPQAEDSFYEDVARSMGDADANPEESGHDRIEIATQIFDQLLLLCIPRRTTLTAKEFVNYVGGQFVTIASRIRPDLLPVDLRSEVDIGKALGLSRAAISRRIISAGDRFQLHLGLRRPSARKRFREVQRSLYASGRRTARGAVNGKRKPPTRRTRSAV